MSLKEMLKPSSKGDAIAIPGPPLMFLSVILLTIYESYLCLIPLAFGFLLLGAGIAIDNRDEKRKNEQKKKKDVLFENPEEREGR